MDLAVRNGLCWRHYDRIRKGSRNPTGPKDRRQAHKNKLDPFETLFEAHLRLADISTDSNSDATYERAKDNFRKAAVRYAAALRAQAIKKAQELAWKRGAQKGRPPKPPRGTSRWARWRRAKFRALFVLHSPRRKSDFLQHARTGTANRRQL